MKKLRLPSLVVLVHGTNRSPRSAEHRPGWPCDCEDNATEVGWPGASDTVKSQCSNFERYPLRHWQPMKDVAKNRRGVLVFTKTDNETSGGAEYHL